MRIFEIRQSLNESAITASNVAPHSFCGELSQAHFSEMSEIMSEASMDLAMNANSGVEILIECAISDGDKLTALCESVFSNIIDKVKAFFRKAKQVVLGIIEKLKLHLVSLEKNVTKWLKVVEKPLENGMRHKADFEYEGYIWKTSEIAAILDKATKVADTVEAEKDIESMKKVSEMVNSGKVDEKDVEDAVSTLSKGGIKDINGLKDYENDSKEDAIKYIEGILGYKYDEYKERIRKDVRGGEKKPIKGFKEGDSPETMLKFVKDSGDLISKMKDDYEKLSTSLSKCLSALESIKFDTSKYDEGNPSKSYVADLSTAASTLIRLAIELVKTRQGVVDSLRALALDLTTKCKTDYMSVLTRLARFKPAK